MQLAILHYHLNRGGVACVAENHLLALAEADPQLERVVVLHGGRAGGWPQERLAARRLPFPLQIFTVAGLDYDSPNGDSPNGDSLGSATEDSADTSQSNRIAGLCLPAGTRSAQSPQREVLSLAEAIVSVLDRARFDRARTLLHWHNHALGKSWRSPQGSPSWPGGATACCCKSTTLPRTCGPTTTSTWPPIERNTPNQ